MLERALLLAGGIRPRLVERPLWRWRHRRGWTPPDDQAFTAAFGFGGDFLPAFAERHARRFGLHLGARDEYRRALDQAGVPPEPAEAAAERTLRGEMELLGSGPVSLGRPIEWHCDFKSGHRWPADLSWRIDYTALDQPTDVKVPWELSRFHWATWLGQAYWTSGDERYAEGFRAMTESWLDANPVAFGINWAIPMELAIRGANWALAFGFFQGSSSIPSAFWLRYLKVLYAHGELIRHNLEYERLLGNHYLSNGFGLLALGLAFRETRTGRRWLRRGHAILEREMRRQVHPDGVSYEKSISYHRLVLELFYTAAVLARRDGVAFSEGFHHRLRRMFQFTAAYSRPDGSTPLVSDADDGRVLRLAPEDPPTDHRHALQIGAWFSGEPAWKAAAGPVRPDLVWLGGPAGVRAYLDLPPVPAASGSVRFPDGGFAVLRSADTHMFLDAGEIGFWGQSIHGHNDTLSFELHAPGGTFIVDSGTYLYTSDPKAYRAFASTRAHNTVMVDGEEIAEFAGLWRVVEDGTDPKVLEWVTGAAEERWVAEHYGYLRLRRPVTHRREVRFVRADRAWIVTDELLGEGVHRVELNLHLAPTAVVSRRGEGEIIVGLGGGALRLSSPDRIDLVEGWVAPRYGVRHHAPVARVSRTGELPIRLVTSMVWQPASLSDGGGVGR